MTKAELIDAIAEKLSQKKKDVATVVDAVFASIEGALAKEEKCTFVGFGVFEVKTREARVGHNPRTKEQIKIPASRLPQFKAGKALKDAVAK